VVSKKSSRVSPARWAAFRVLNDWEPRRTFFDDLLEKWRRSLSDEDFRLAYNISFGVLRHQHRLDAWIDALTNQGIHSLPMPLVWILRMAFYQIAFLDRIPIHAITNEAVLLCRAVMLETLSGVVNAIVRKFSTDKDFLNQPTQDNPDILGTLTSHPDWLVKWALNRFGEELATRWLQQNNQQPYICLYPLLFRVRGTDLMNLYRNNEVDYLCYGKGGGPLTGIPSFKEGFVYVQDPSAHEAVKLLDPQPGEHILDACCAPGGKTLQIADMTEDKAEILAVDTSQSRLKKVKENLARCKITSVKTQCRDLTQPWSNPPHKFDAILLDVPCSGLGTIRHHPDLRYRLQPHDITELADKALLLLRMTATLLRSGGRLVYSTCTLTQEENEGVLQRFLKDPQTDPDSTFNLVTMKYTPSFLFDSTEPIPEEWPNCDGSFCALLVKE
jgi:16S rRNA (cytosine967-C5)-methyltransferase